ncbi:NXPE family member 3-like isoform X2 [Apostichopus japonicus]|uniref:NXPE family member 3-like isoform X2 n=1 Tax=Stichopus japonicus TaxID=307972 RepID=UPI003AB8C13C
MKTFKLMMVLLIISVIVIMISIFNCHSTKLIFRKPMTPIYSHFRLAKSAIHTTVVSNSKEQVKLPQVYKNCTSFSTPSKSLVEIVNPRTVYRVSEQVIIRIEARTANGSIQPFGGDFLRMKLFSKKPYSAIGPDTFIDYDNGTYLATFTLRWQGIVNVSVQLVHSSCVIDIMKGVTQKSIEEGLLFWGKFERQLKKGTSYSENVHCGHVPRQFPYCNVSANHTHGPWFCNKPENTNITCHDWTESSFDMSKSSENLRHLLTDVEYTALERTKIPLTTLPMPSFKVEASNITSSFTTSQLPLCTFQPVPSGIATRGFFRKNIWQPFDCRLTNFKSEQIKSCLNGKSMHFFGDSTARQLYKYVEVLINCTAEGNFWIKLCSQGNVSILFKFHGPPVRIVHSAPIRQISYLTDEIDALKGGPGVYIVVSVWAHIGMPDGHFYKARLISIKSAIDRLLQRSPETRIIVRSANTRDHSIGAFLLVSSDWVALKGERTLREVFSKDERISFLDVWDMTLVQQSHDYIHPHLPTLVQTINYLFTMICK